MPTFAPVVRLGVGEGLSAGLEFEDEDGDGDMARGAVVPKLEDGGEPDEEVGAVVGIDVDDVDVDVGSEGTEGPCVEVRVEEGGGDEG